MKELKNIGLALLLFLGIVGGIGSLGYLIWLKAWVIAAGEGVVIGFAAPTWYKMLKKILG